MHTLRKEVDGEVYYVHHNGDWSGEAIIVKESQGEIARLPGKLLLACGTFGVCDDIIAMIESKYL